MPLSIFDLFKIGIGPSSSHTVGPMRAALTFVRALVEKNLLESVSQVDIVLYGSLSATGVGHCTDSATLLGLMGFDPETVDTQQSAQLLNEVNATEQLWLNNTHPIRFVYDQHVSFSSDSLPFHPNAMTLRAWQRDDLLYEDTYYSIGGGFIVTGSEDVPTNVDVDSAPLPYPFRTGAELLKLCDTYQLSICQLMLENEKTMRSEAEIRQRILTIWSVMQTCIAAGIEQKACCPAGLTSSDEHISFTKHYWQPMHRMSLVQR